MDDKFDKGSYFSGPLMAYNNNYGFNLGDRACLIRDYDRGQRASKYTRLSDHNFNQAEVSLGRFNFDSVGDNPFVVPLQQQQQQQQVFIAPPQPLQQQ